MEVLFKENGYNVISITSSSVITDECSEIVYVYNVIKSEYYFKIEYYNDSYFKINNRYIYKHTIIETLDDIISDYDKTINYINKILKKRSVRYFWKMSFYGIFLIINNKILINCDIINNELFYTLNNKDYYKTINKSNILECLKDIH